MAGGVTLHPSRRAVFDKKSQFFDCNRRTIHRLSKMSTALAAKAMSLGAVMTLIIGSAGASLTELILLRSIFKPKIIAAEHIDVELAANQ